MTKQSLHEKLTHQIVEAMESATNFQMPWHSEQELPVNAFTNNKYKGINTVSLWASSMKQSYDSSVWSTYRQWQELGAQVEKGQKSSTIILYKPLTGKDGEPIYNTEPPYRQTVFMRSASVFNANQVTGYESKVSTNTPTEDLTIKLATVDAYVSGSKASITIGGHQAYYNCKADKINIPERHLFTGSTTCSPTEAFYSTLLHELVHWTGTEKRCNRDHTGRFGNSAYAKEELVAELGSAFLCADLGITSSPREDHASYINSWIKVLKDDDKAIFSAASNATTAVNYLNKLQLQLDESIQPITAIQQSLNLKH